MSVNTAARTVEQYDEDRVEEQGRHSDRQSNTRSNTQQSVHALQRPGRRRIDGGTQVARPSGSGPARPRAYGDRVLESARTRFGLIDLDDLVNHRSAPRSEPDLSDPASPMAPARGWLTPVVPLVAGTPRRLTTTVDRADLSMPPAPLPSAGVRRVRHPRAAAAGQPEPTTSPVVRRTRVRPTARGQVVAVVLLALLIVGVSATSNLSRSDAERSMSALEGARQISVAVQPGDTLFSIARRTLPTVEATVAVAVIRSINGLSDADVAGLRPGQVLRVPTA